MTTPAPCRLVLVRHGESEWNASGRWQGHGGSGLSARGREEAAATAERLASEFADAAVLVRSDLERVAQTAAPIAATLGLPAAVDPRLRELDCGAWTGLTHGQIARSDPERYAAWARGADVAAGGGERVADLQARVVAALHQLLETQAGTTVVVVTHGGPIRVGVAGLLGRQIVHLGAACAPVGNCSLTVLAADGQVRVERYGDRSHLKDDTPPAGQGPL